MKSADLVPPLGTRKSSFGSFSSLYSAGMICLAALAFLAPMPDSAAIAIMNLTRATFCVHSATRNGVHLVLEWNTKSLSPATSVPP